MASQLLTVRQVVLPRDGSMAARGERRRQTSIMEAVGAVGSAAVAVGGPEAAGVAAPEALAAAARGAAALGIRCLRLHLCAALGQRVLLQQGRRPAPYLHPTPHSQATVPHQQAVSWTTRHASFRYSLLSGKKHVLAMCSAGCPSQEEC